MNTRIEQHRATPRVAGDWLRSGALRKTASTLLAATGMLALTTVAEAQWDTIPGPGFNASTMLLLTDGSVICHQALGVKWKKLTPDATGSYLNGSWSDIADMSTPRLYYTSAVLADGRVFVAGGEYDDNVSGADQNEFAQVYDPVADSWTSEVNPLGWSTIGDASGTILPDGRFLFGRIGNTANGGRNVAIFDPTAPWGPGAFTAVADKPSISWEEGWVLMQDGSVFTVTCSTHPNVEKYLPWSDEWISMTDTPTWSDNLDLVEAASAEIGPTFVLPDGRVFQVGATGHNGIFVPGVGPTDTGTWVQGPDFPTLAGPMSQGSKDGPGCWMPNGKVLVTVGPVDGVQGNYLTGVNFYLYTPGGINDPGTLTAETAAPGGSGTDVNYQGRMLLLPTGQVLYTRQDNNVYIYTPTGGPNPAWRPKITSWPGSVKPGVKNYAISGQQFNGISQGANYGDDAEMTSNYPLVRIRNHASGNVFYCRTHDHSTMGIAPGPAIVSTYFDTPAGLEPGLSDLVVIGNGVASEPIVINGAALAYNAERDLQFGSVCPGTFKDLNLTIFNVGIVDLNLQGIQRVAGSTDISVQPNPGSSVVIEPGSHIDFTVRYTPNTAGSVSSTIRISSDDPNRPSIDLIATGSQGHSTIKTTIPDAGDFGNVCVSDDRIFNLEINNSGDCDLVISNIQSTSPQFEIATVLSYNITVNHGTSIAVPIRFKPTASGPATGTIQITSNDPSTPVKNVPVKGTTPYPNIVSGIAASGNFGNVCIGSYKDLDVTINNTGGCDLIISGIGSSSTEFATASILTYPLVVRAGDSLRVPIRFQPALPFGSKGANITIASNDPDGPQVFSVTGFAPSGDIRVTGPNDFGIVCAGVVAEKRISICNVGLCDLHVASVTVDCPDFTIVNNPFTATVSHDFCMDVVVLFTPTSCGPKSCKLTIVSDDPDQPEITWTLTANTPCASLTVVADQCFPATVIQSVGACTSSIAFPIANAGPCPVKITGVTTTGPYSVKALPTLPLSLPSGGTLGDGDFKVVFAPTLLSRDNPGTISVTYEIDPITHTTATITRNLNGEGVRTGARVLVMANGAPMAKVEKIQLQRINANRNKNLLDTAETYSNATLQTVTQLAPCGSFQFHREYSTVDNPIQLLPGSYQVTATGIVNGKRISRTVGFNVDTCTFNPNIVITLK